MAVEWQPDTFRDFLDLLTHALQDGSPTTCKRLKKTLSDLRGDIAQLFREPPKDPNTRREINQGTISINGKKQQANGQFAEAVIFLSDLLAINEGRAASLFQYAYSIRARHDGWSPIRIAVDVYHNEREYMLESLILMMTRFVRGKAPGETLKIVKQFMEQMLSLQVPFPKKLIQTVALLKSTLRAFVQDPTAGGALSDQQAQRLGVEQEVITTHADRLGKERSRMGDLLYYTTARWQLTVEEILMLLRELQTADVPDAATISLLVSFIVNLSTSATLHDVDNEQRLHLKGSNFDVLRKEIEETRWHISGLQGVAWTQWVCFMHCCLTETIDEHVVDGDFRMACMNQMDGAGRRWRDTVGRCNEVYNFVIDYIITFKRNKDEIPPSAGPMPQGLEDLEDDIRDAYIFRVEQLVDGLLVNLRRYLKDIKCSDEDATRASQATTEENQGASNCSSQPAAAVLWSRQSDTAWEALLSLITVLYRDRPDAAVSFWRDPLYRDMDEDVADIATSETLAKQAFVKMASDVTTTRFLRIFIHMLASLATGRISAQEVHVRLNSDPPDSQFGQVLWITFFRSLNTVIDLLGRGASELKQDELGLITAFLRLLRQVVKFSYSARRTLCDNQHLRAIHTLFWLLVSRIPVELKGALLETIAAFCVPLGNSYDIQAQVWQMLEQAQIVPTQNKNAGFNIGEFGNGAQSVRDLREGIITDLEEIEAPSRTYPETLAFLRLINVLLQGPENVHMTSVLQTLGNAERFPGIRPYIRFVANHVFLKAHIRDFNDPSERWEMISSCLQIFDRCLNLFDLGLLVAENPETSGETELPTDIAAGGFGSQVLENARMLTIHPGFELICRILSNAKLTEKLFDVLAVGVEQVNESIGRMALRGKAILSAFRIILRVLQSQRVFLEVLAPALLEGGVAEPVELPASMGGIDHLLAFRKDVVVHIVKYTLCVDDEICLSAVNVLTTLSKSPVFGVIDGVAGVNRLVSILHSSPDSDAMISGFVKRLEMEEDEEYVASVDVREATGASGILAVYDDDKVTDLQLLLLEDWQSRAWPNPKIGLVHLVRISVLDLLLMNVTAVRPPPTIAHFLLGYDVRKPLALTNIDEPTAPGAKYSCLHAILDLIRMRTQNGPNAKGTEPAEFEGARPTPLFETHPRLAERCYRLIYHLCCDSHTSAPTMRYLRNQEDFFYEQLKALPVDKPDVNADQQGNASAILAQLLQRAWLMKCIALELHVTTGAQQRTQAQRLVNLLYITPMQSSAQYANRNWQAEMDVTEEDEEDMDEGVEDHVVFEQPLTKIMEILNSMSFEDTYRLPGKELTTVFRNINLEDFRRNGIYDIRAIHHHLTVASRKLDSAPEAMAEIRRILNVLLDINFYQEIGAARCHTAQAWGQIVQVTMMRCFTLLAADIRENKLFEMLSTLLPKMNSERTSAVIAESMSTVILVLMEEMQADRMFQSLLQTASVQSEPSTIRLPSDTLQQVILRGILDGILMPGASVTMRGNLYVALMRLLQYTKPEELELLQQSNAETAEPQTISSAASVVSDNEAGPLVASRARLLQGNYGIITAYGDRLLETIYRDASDGNGVWNIVAFAVLEVISEQASWNRRGGVKAHEVLDIMVKRNFLGHFVRSIKEEDDRALQDVFTNEADSMNAQLMFEMKMAFLLRISLTREGAQKLMEYGVIEALADCKFIDQKPDAEIHPSDYDDISMSISERYHEVMLPTFELVSSIARQMQKEYNASSKISRFAVAHQHVLANILKDNSPVITIASLRQLELVTSLFSYLADNRKLLEKELAIVGHSSFHNLLLGLLNKYTNPNKWATLLQPVTRVEQEKDRTMVACRPTNISNFRQEAEALATKVCRNLLSYAQTVTDWNGSKESLKKEPIFTPNFNAESDKATGIGLLSAVPKPALGMICTFTSRVVEALMQSIDDHKHLALKISEIQRLSVDEITEITRSMEEFNEELSAAQRRQWALLQLHRTMKKKAQDISTFLYLIEHLLLLIWRHAVFFLSQTNITSTSKSADKGPGSWRTRFSLEGDNVRLQLNNALTPILNRLQSLELAKSVIGNAETRKAFLNMVMRQLRELLQQQE